VVIEAAPTPMFVLNPLSHLAYHPVRDVALWAGADQSSYMDSITLPDGGRRQVLITKVALARLDGRPRGVIGSITDVTSFHEVGLPMPINAGPSETP
jgi:hypothetical protein